VTEKGTRLLDIFDVLADGRTDGPFPQFSRGFTPFGFAFGPSNSVIISEAENRFPLESTTSSYRLIGTHHLQPVSPTVPAQQTAACWVAVTGDIAWVVNTGSATITSFQIGADGASRCSTRSPPSPAMAAFSTCFYRPQAKLPSTA
jgi:hypothetical protein